MAEGPLWEHPLFKTACTWTARPAKQNFQIHSGFYILRRKVPRCALFPRLSGLVSVLTQQCKSGTQEPTGSAIYSLPTGVALSKFYNFSPPEFPSSSNKDEVAPLLRLDVSWLGGLIRKVLTSKGLGVWKCCVLGTPVITISTIYPVNSKSSKCERL